LATAFNYAPSSGSQESLETVLWSKATFYVSDWTVCWYPLGVPEGRTIVWWTLWGWRFVRRNSLE